MRNKTGIIVLTIIITALCLYSLSFSFVGWSVENEATEHATKNGVVSSNEKQQYLDSIADLPAYNFLGLEYTYRQVKEKQLAMGLDLQGGMHVTLEVSPIEILTALSGNSTDPSFQRAMQLAKDRQATAQENFTRLFFNAYRELQPNTPLKNIFVNANTREKLGNNTSDDAIMRMIDEEVDNARDRAILILHARIDKFGVTSPNIQPIKGTNRILVEMPGVEDAERVRKQVSDVAQLEFLEVYHLGEIAPWLTKVNEYLLSQEKKEGKGAKGDLLSQNKNNEAPQASNNDLLEDTSATAKTDTNKAVAKADSLKKDSTEQKASILFTLLKADPNMTDGLRYSTKDTAKINRALRNPVVQQMIPKNVALLWEKRLKKAKNSADEKDEQIIELVVVKKERSERNTLTGDVIVRARAERNQNRGSQYEISMTMNPPGAAKWKRMTAKAAQDKRRIAIALDNIVYSAPTVREEIPSGQSSISGDFDFEEAKDLANVIQAGKLPAPMRIVEEAIVGPNLGKEAISQGLLSSVCGLILVVIFMIAYYGKGGFIADAALVFNMFFILGLLAQPQLGTALTLPGIAGIVLTIGMAVDANVLIFERIREELRSGKSVSAALSLGYDKAFSSIFDSNLTTLLTAIILAWLGSGPVKGFAVTLIIGIFTSFFTSVFISRVFLEWLDRKKKLNEKSFDTGFSRNLFKKMNFDFIGNRRKAYMVSGVIIALGLISIAIKGGLTMGVDFKGGRSYIVQFSEPVVASDVKSKLVDNFNNAGTEVKTYGDNTKLKITTSYLVGDESEDADKKVLSALNEGLKEMSSLKPAILGSSKVGATIADDIKSSSYQAIALSLIAIFLYILVRFRRWQFGLGAIIALAHDVLMCFAAYGFAELLGHPLEIDQVFIAAILTVIGYSINDTVVVFDRVRETLSNNQRMDLKGVMNVAINDTISRTIITATTVFIVSVVLFIFGGETLRGFSLVMLIGTTFGTYSSIFIATPIVLDFGKKNEDVATLAKKEPVKKDSVKI